MCGGPREGPECLRGAIQPGYGNGWALAIPIGGCMGSTRYSTLLVPTCPHPPGTHLHPPRTPLPGHATPGTASLASTKKILGVDNALYLATALRYGYRTKIWLPHSRYGYRTQDMATALVSRLTALVSRLTALVSGLQEPVRDSRNQCGTPGTSACCKVQ